MTPLPAGGRSAITIPVLVAIAFVLVAGGIGASGGVAGESLSATNATPIEHSHDPATVSVDPAVQNAAGEVELILYLDSLSRADIRAAEDPVEQLQSHSQTVQPAVQSVLDQHDSIEVKSSSWLANSLLISVDLDQQSLDQLAAIDGVERIGENTNITTLNQTAVRSNPAGSDTTDTATTYGLAQIGAPEAWATHDTRGDGVRVAVVDTGIDVTHPDLELVTDDADDPTYPGGWAEFDQDGNRVTGSTPYDTGSHGTHVSGTVAGGNASGTHIGVAPDVELMHALGIDASAGGTMAQVIAAVEWAVLNDADIVSLSLGSSDAVPADISWIRNTKAAGVHVVAASGNSGAETTIYPAVVTDAFAVGASDSDRNIASFSSGDTVETSAVWEGTAPKGWPDSYIVPDVAAPGVDVQSTVPNDEYTQLSGTSMATPHVSGALALLLAASDESNLTPVAYERALIDSATKPAEEPADQDTRYGHGIIDVPAAIERLQAYDGGVSGTVTDTNGNPIPRADVRAEAGIRTVTDETGGYRLNSTSGETVLTTTAFGYETATREIVVPERGGSTEHVTLDEIAELSVVADVPRVVDSGDTYTGTLRIGNTDSYTVAATDNSTVSTEAIDITIDGDQIALGETVNFTDTIERTIVDLTVRTDETITDDTLTLQHTVRGVNDTNTVHTGQTTITSERDPAHFEITAFESTERVPENGTVSINATVKNSGEQTDTQSIDYQIHNGDIKTTATLETVELVPGETTQLDKQVPVETLTPGEYTQSVTSDDSTSQRSLEVVERGTVSIALTPPETEGPAGTEQTLDIVVRDPFDGLSAYNITLSTADTDTVQIVDVDPARTDGTGTTTVASDGATAHLNRTVDTDPHAPAAETTVGTVQLQLNTTGNTTLRVDENSTLRDQTGSQYTVRTTEMATVSVTDTTSGVDVTGDGVPATDTTGDGRLNDINGDGEFTIVDVQLFFEYRNTDVVQTRPEQFDFAEDGTVDIFDVQALYEQLQSGVDVTGDGVPATDTTGDGRLNDINGDGEFTIGDVQLFFEYRNTDAVQTRPERFDFAEDGTVGIFDVQALYEQLKAS